MKRELPIWRRPAAEAVILVSLGVLSVLIQCYPSAGEAMQWTRGTPLVQQLITGFTGHLAHWSWDHLLWDVVAFFGLGLAAIRILPGRLIACLGIAAIAIPLEISLFRPEFASYRGLSGLDSAFFGLLLAGLWRQGGRARILTLVGLTGFLSKIGYELFTGGTLFVDHETSGFVPVPTAHLVGLAAGMFAGNTKLWVLVRFFAKPARLRA